MIDAALHTALVAEASLAPSVHNIQPARFRFAEDGAIHVFEDTRRRIPVGDPSGADNWKSLGAAAEGMVMALGARGHGAEVTLHADTPTAPLRHVATIRIAGESAPDPLRAHANARATWRGLFAPAATAHPALETIAACADIQFVTRAHDIADIAALFDRTSLETLRDGPYRAELVSWMRLSRRHPDWTRDGLNAEAMALSAFEAMGAGLAMGPRGFPLLDRLGLAGPLIAEGAKAKSAASIGLFHRPATEHPFLVGRRFYRLWLEIAAAGLWLCPMSVLADSPAAAAALRRTYGFGDDRTLVNVFRIGPKPASRPAPPRVRLPVAELIV